MWITWRNELPAETVGLPPPAALGALFCNKRDDEESITALQLAGSFSAARSIS
jgi:hypothetical protein